MPYVPELRWRALNEGLQQRNERISELEHAIRDACITLRNDRYDVRVDNALATLEDVVEDAG